MSHVSKTLAIDFGLWHAMTIDDSRALVLFCVICLHEFLCKFENRTLNFSYQLLLYIDH
jgi:hypothetical protein